jgi:predicted MFS family arabinose efflux permease
VNAIKRSAAERLSPDSTGTDGGAGNSHLNGASGQKHVSSQDAPISSMPSRCLVFLLAITSGLVAMNIFYNQPILNEIGGSLKVESSAVAWVAIVTQLGYAAGLLLVVPIGDSIDRKHLITATTIVSSGALLMIPLAPNLPIMLLASFAVGFTSVTPQLAIPYVAGLIPGAGRGKVVGMVMSGLLIGILISRTLSGFVGSRFSWQIVFWFAAAAMVSLSVILHIALPAQPVHGSVSYARLLASLPRLLAREPILRQHSILGALSFGTFGAFWTTLAFYLHSQPEHYGADVSGMFGLVAITGALVAPLAGHLGERWSPRHVNGLFFALILVAFIVMLFSQQFTLPILALGVLLLDAGVQGNQIANQARIYTLNAALHSRINAVYMVIYFIGGSLGSLVGAQAWGVFGWPGVCLIGIVLSTVGLSLLWIQRFSIPKFSPTLPKKVVRPSSRNY